MPPKVGETPPNVTIPSRKWLVFLGLSAPKNAGVRYTVLYLMFNEWTKTIVLGMIESTAPGID